MVRRRLLRDADIAFPRPGTNWPHLPEQMDARGWARDRALLGKRGWRSKWRNAQHIYGIASHDLYHAGQIQLLKRLQRGG